VSGVRAAVLAGCEVVVLTNAAGSLRPELAVGTTVVISDQLNLTGTNPMAGPEPPDGLPSRFVDLTDLYSSRLRSALRQRRPARAEGVYAGLLGGSFETPAEIRMLGSSGADLVGMSTVLEAIAAKHLGAEVVGLSLVTNLAAGLQERVDHLEVLDVGVSAGDEMAAALTDVLQVVAGRGAADG
jgi:purine-nucleoside phosphorylase